MATKGSPLRVSYMFILFLFSKNQEKTDNHGKCLLKLKHKQRDTTKLHLSKKKTKDLCHQSLITPRQDSSSTNLALVSQVQASLTKSAKTLKERTSKATNHLKSTFRENKLFYPEPASTKNSSYLNFNKKFKKWETVKGISAHWKNNSDTLLTNTSMLRLRNTELRLKTRKESAKTDRKLTDWLGS